MVTINSQMGFFGMVRVARGIDSYTKHPRRFGGRYAMGRVLYGYTMGRDYFKLFCRMQINCGIRFAHVIHMRDVIHVVAKKIIQLQQLVGDVRVASLALVAILTFRVKGKYLFMELNKSIDKLYAIRHTNHRQDVFFHA